MACREISTQPGRAAPPTTSIDLRNQDGQNMQMGDFWVLMGYL